MRQRLGDSIAASYRCYSPPVDDLSAYVDLGSTPQGIPVRIFRPVAEADLRILIGSVLPHLQAGFGGGYKLIFPGTSHRTTLGALHRQGLEGKSDPAGLLGGSRGRQPDAAGDPRGSQTARAMLVDQPLDRRSGTGFSGGCRGSRAASRIFWRPRRGRRFQAPPSAPADLIVAGNHPWPGDPMQSFKVLLQHRAACRSGGVLVGLFWTDPAEIDRSFPISVLRRIAATGALGAGRFDGSCRSPSGSPRPAGSPAAFMLRWACELVVDRTVLVYAPPLRDRLGPRLGPVRLFADQAALWHAAAMALDRQSRLAGPLSVRVFPQGGLTYVTAIDHRVTQ